MEYINYAICVKVQDTKESGFLCGHVYQCSDSFNGMIEIMNDSGNAVLVDSNCRDFVVINNIAIQRYQY